MLTVCTAFFIINGLTTTSEAFLQLREEGTMGSFGETPAKPNDWSACPSDCKCKWVSGKKAAECTNTGLIAIPTTLSSELQTVDLSGNSLQDLAYEAFKSVGLVNLHKIYLKNCKIETVDKGAFRGLQILIELDLSDNKIHTLHAGTFKENERLRVFFFNRNPIQKLEDDLFSNLQFLQTVEMTGCNLSHFGLKAFNNVTNLQHLYIDGNHLSFIKLAAIEKLQKLRSLVLNGNPWRCDCHLRSFRDWIMERNLYSQLTACAEPSHLQNRFWNEIQSKEFACKPHITYPTPGTSVTTDTDQVTLSCQVNGNPTPEVYWVFNSRIITNNSRATYGDLRYTVTSQGNESKWVNLTISKVHSHDHGEFTCVAKNPGGMDERNITVLINTPGATFDNDIKIKASWPLTVGLIAGVVALLILIIIFCFCFCRKRSRNHRKKSSANVASSNTDLSCPMNPSAEQVKRLLNKVNTAEKQAQIHGNGSSPTNEGSQLLELKKILNDDTNTLVSNGGDIERSMESLPALRSKNERSDTYPPDLIAFGRASVSPAPVSSGNLIDSSRMRPHVGSHSPMNNSMVYCFGTLPYSRSESPFSPVAPVVLPKQGYVTIPRRPRVPSWSSAPTPTLLDDRLSPLKAEPVYDNLGPRTTVDGSSALSLNKEIANETLRKLSNMSPLHYPIDKGSYISKNDTLPPDIKNVPGLKRVSSAEGNFNGDTYAPLTPKCKIAPKPPPKPNKNVTLYEDETEDGTEV